MQRPVRRVGVIAAALLLFAGEATLAQTVNRTPLLIAHLGVGQTYSHVGLGPDDCTATRIDPPKTELIENTIASIAASFGAGADIVQIDVHPTTDGQFAVFHDWGLDCRTDGHGVTREHSMAALRKLDIGYGYTADGGKTFPLRGKGVGLMPSLDEVLARFPDRRFLIVVKSNEVHEGERLAAHLSRLSPQMRERLMVSGGGDAPIDVLRAELPDLRVMSTAQLKRCATSYIKSGGAGEAPVDCRHTLVLVPVNLTGLLPGWPDLFLARMEAAGSLVFVAGPYQSGDAFAGLNNPAELAKLPKGYAGGIWTDDIQKIGPLVKQTSP